MKPLVIGHAAAAGEAPANTLAGVRASLDARAEGMEIDVQLCGDGVAVLMHDLTVDRTTNLTGRVRELPLAALQAADAGAGEPVPTLDQVFSLVAGRLMVMCELKVDHESGQTDTELVEAVAALIAANGAESWTAIHSFDPEIVATARRVAPQISAAIIAPRQDTPGFERYLSGVVRRGAQALSLEYNCITREYVVRAHRRQVTLWCWTADNPADWRRLTACGVDGIITNVPHQLRAWLDARG